MVEDIALHIEIGAVADFYRPAVAQGGDQGLSDGGQGLAVWPLDRLRILDAHQLLLDFAQGLPLHILKEEGVAHAEHLAVDLEGPLARLVLDPEIIAEGD